MPLCYGGGINIIHQIKELVGLGIEKVAISSFGLNNPDLLG